MEEVDGIIEKRATEEPPVVASYDDEISKMASELLTTGQGVVVDSKPEEYTFNEKLAYSMAMAEVFINLPYIQKLASFEKKAYEHGHTPEQIEEALTKAGAAERYVPLSKVMDLRSKSEKKKK
jgi:hypothetical protein